MTQLDKDTEIVINILHMFKKAEESISMLERDVEIVKKKIKLIEMKTTMSKMKNILDGSNSRLDMTEVEISELKDITTFNYPK